VLCITCLVLFCLGLAVIYSVGLTEEGAKLTDFKKQMIFGVVGFVLFFVISLSNYSGLWVYGRIIFASAIILLVAVLFLGATIRGTQGWFSLGGIGLQPVELAKIALIILLAKFFSNRLQRFKSGKHIIVSLFICLCLAVPVLLQPDMGSALILFGLWFILLALTGIKKSYFIILVVVFLILFLLVGAFLLKDYQRERIKIFFNPQADPQGSGYNVSQSIIGIGSGRFWGRGLGFGSQSQLKFIPEAKTDFIFAVIAEELGLIGVLFVLGGWGLIFYRLQRIAKQAKNDFGMFLVLGVMVLFFLHLLVNVGMNIGLMPVMGISLPLLSYGGSFLIASLILIGIAESVYVRR